MVVSQKEWKLYANSESLMSTVLAQFQLSSPQLIFRAQEIAWLVDSPWACNGRTRVFPYTISSSIESHLPPAHIDTRTLHFHLVSLQMEQLFLHLWASIRNLKWKQEDVGVSFHRKLNRKIQVRKWISVLCVFIYSEALCNTKIKVSSLS